MALISLAAHQGYVRLGHTAHEAVHTIPIRWRELMPYKRYARGYEVPWCPGVALLPQE